MLIINSLVWKTLNVTLEISLFKVIFDREKLQFRWSFILSLLPHHHVIVFSICHLGISLGHIYRECSLGNSECLWHLCLHRFLWVNVNISIYKLCLSPKLCHCLALERNGRNVFTEEKTAKAHFLCIILSWSVYLYNSVEHLDFLCFVCNRCKCKKWYWLVCSLLLSVVPHWFWFGEEVSRQPHSAAHTLQRRQELDWHSSLRLHQCTPGDRAEVRIHSPVPSYRNVFSYLPFLSRKLFQDEGTDLGIQQCVFVLF